MMTVQTLNGFAPNSTEIGNQSLNWLCSQNSCQTKFKMEVFAILIFTFLAPTQPLLH